MTPTEKDILIIVSSIVVVVVILTILPKELWLPVIIISPIPPIP